METTYLVLLILLIIYIPLYIYVRKSEKAHDKGFVPYGPTIMIRTKWGLKLMDRLARYKRFWRFMGAVSLVISAVLAIAILTILIIDLTLLPSMFGRAGMGIEYALAIPGLNPILPIVYGIIGLVFAMVIHEMAHGIQSRANDIKVNSSGILYGVVPLGAFVEPDEEETEKASRRARMHVYAAGITTNTFAAIIVFAIMAFSMTGGLTSDYSDNGAVYSMVSDTEAYDLDIDASSILVSVDGTPVDMDGLIDHLKKNQTSDLKRYDVGFVYKDNNYIRNMALGACIGSVISGSPADDAGFKKGMFVTQMERVEENDTIVTKFINTPEEFSDFMSETTPGQTVWVTYYTYDTETKTFSDKIVSGPIPLDKNGSKGYLGIAMTISGISFTTPQAMLDAGIDPTYGREGIRDISMGVLSYISQPFRGFSPIPESVTWWYESTTVSDEVFWVFIWTLYWIFWLDIVLAVSNALPAMPFDGGLLMMGTLDWLFEKAGVKDPEERDKKVGRVGGLISYTMLFILILVLVAVII